MDLVLDIGNTETHAGVFDRDRLHAHWRWASDPRRTADEYGILLHQLLRSANVDARSVRSASLASVLPALTSVIADTCWRYLGIRVLVVDARLPLPMRIEVDEPFAVGADRIVNTLAAHRLYGRDCVVVDLGTATTYDCISRDGVFIGGVIAPGVRTAADQLSDRTAKLPRVALAAPSAVIGRRTEACLQSGIFYGAVDAVEGMVRRIRNEWRGADVFVVATGGLSPLIAPHCPSIQMVEPSLTLLGVRMAYEYTAARLAAGTDDTDGTGSLGGSTGRGGP
jgi:type III pantothenate kinase